MNVETGRDQRKNAVGTSRNQRFCILSPINTLQQSILAYFSLVKRITGQVRFLQTYRTNNTLASCSINFAQLCPDRAAPFMVECQLSLFA